MPIKNQGMKIQYFSMEVNMSTQNMKNKTLKDGVIIKYFSGKSGLCVASKHIKEQIRG